eukprot:1660299-Amphidinium_carterae.1
MAEPAAGGIALFHYFSLGTVLFGTRPIFDDPTFLRVAVESAAVYEHVRATASKGVNETIAEHTNTVQKFSNK